MGEPYLVTLSPKTYLRLKRTNEKKLLHCHLCGLEFAAGDEVAFNCVLPNTLLIGDNIPISQAQIGGHTIGVTMENNIEQTMKREYNGNLIKIKAGGMLPILVTEEHPIWTVQPNYKRVSKTNVHKRFFDNAPQWKAASDLKRYKHAYDGDFLIMPKIKGYIDVNEIDISKYSKLLKNTKLRVLPINKETAWLIGLYVAEGSNHDSRFSSFSFSLGSDEMDLVKRSEEILGNLGVVTSHYIMNDDSVCLVVAVSATLTRALKDWCGYLAPNKKIPDFIMYHVDEEIPKAFMEGYLLGDGHFNKGRRMAKTASRLLALQVQLLGTRLGRYFSIREYPPAVRIVKGHKANYKGGYVLGQIGRGGERATWPKDYGEYLVTPITKIEVEKYQGPVYNLQTTDETFLVNNAITHNCGSSRKRYHAQCSKKVNFEINPPANYEETRKAVLAEVEAWKKTEKQKTKEEKKQKK